MIPAYSKRSNLLENKLRAIRSIKDFQEFQKSIDIGLVSDNESVSDSEQNSMRSVSNEVPLQKCQMISSPSFSSASMVIRSSSNMKLIKRQSSNCLPSPPNSISRSTMVSKDTTPNKANNNTSSGRLSQLLSLEIGKLTIGQNQRIESMTPNLLKVTESKTNLYNFTLSEVPESNSACDENPN